MRVAQQELIGSNVRIGGNKGEIPNPGDIIFFDWEGSGQAQHVGIVERVEGDVVHTIEGNSNDMCLQRQYIISSSFIFEYGIIV